MKMPCLALGSILLAVQSQTCFAQNYFVGKTVVTSAKLKMTACAKKECKTEEWDIELHAYFSDTGRAFLYQNDGRVSEITTGKWISSEKGKKRIIVNANEIRYEIADAVNIHWIIRPLASGCQVSVSSKGVVDAVKISSTQLSSKCRLFAGNKKPGELE